jgi:hypothetical protein
MSLRPRARAPAARLRPTPLGRRGIALPIALLGLVVMTLLVTTVLVSSGTEFAVSTAQRDASRSLYNADGALQRYVSEHAQALPANLRFVEGTDVITYGGVGYTLSLARISRVSVAVGPPQVMADTWSVIATPTLAASGRGVGALLTVDRTLGTVTLAVKAGATSGGDVIVGGNATISNGRTGQSGCANGDTAASSLQVTKGSKIEVNGTSVNLEGRADTSSTTKAQLMSAVLGPTMTLDSIAKSATLRFGPFYGTTAPEWDNAQAHSPNQNWSLTTADSLYNWGCPPADASATNITCTTVGAERFVVVGIDATNVGNNGTRDNIVTLNGDYGQGMLIVLRGSLNIQGNFFFRGIILVERDFSIGGGGGQFTGKVEGTVVSFGDRSNVADTYNGNATIRYNQCSVTDALNALNRQRIDNTPQVLNSRTFGWFELVR